MALYGTDIQRWTMVKALEKTNTKGSGFSAFCKKYQSVKVKPLSGEVADLSDYAGKTPPPLPWQNPLPLLRIRSSKVFLTASKMSLRARRFFICFSSSAPRALISAAGEKKNSRKCVRPDKFAWTSVLSLTVAEKDRLLDAKQQYCRDWCRRQIC